MPIFTLNKHVVGTYGQIIRSGPFLDTAGEVRDMSAFVVTCELYPPPFIPSILNPDATPPPDEGGAGQGTADGYLEYRIADGDFSFPGIWTARLFAEDADEKIVGELQTFKVIDTEEGAT